MSVIKFKRNTQKQQLIDLIEDFDFDKGAVIVYFDEDFNDVEGSFRIVTTYETFGLKEALATESVAGYVRKNVYYVENE
ncbi:hypothetical protein [Sinomicrobium sp.]